MTGRAPAMARVARSLVRPLYLVYLGFILAVLYFPFVVMAILSFQGPRGGHTFPLRGVSTIWYWKLFNPGKLTPYSDVGEFLGDYLASLQRSVVLAVITMLISTALALMAAQAFRRGFKGSGIVFYLWLLGIIVPGITVSLGLSLWFRWMDLPLHWLTTGLPVHVMWTLPFSLIIFLMFFNRFDTSLEDAALILGATRWKTFRHVTLPLMQPAILTSLLFAFTLSLDEFQRSLLITGTDQTLPLMVMASVTTRITPTLYALGTLTTLLSFAVVGAYLALLTSSLRKSRRLVEGSGSAVQARGSQ
ncbi:MAG: ABC transporter permease [Candidatus Rokuibacteriota bacterium]|nr:MAG: ABC transporter permease [Candidatus Rokubacteria bacterium]